MKRTLVVVAAVVGFATAASAATLTVFTTDASNAVSNTFQVGDTILLKVDGNAQGGLDNGIHGELAYNGGITDTLGGTMPNWFANTGAQLLSDGLSVVFDGNNGSSVAGAPLTQTGTSVLTLLATGTGVSTVSFGGTSLDFFNIYEYPPTGAIVHTFTIIVPEPATAGLIGLGLLGLVLGGRRRA